MSFKGVIQSFTVAGGRKVVAIKPAAMQVAIKAAMVPKSRPVEEPAPKQIDERRVARG